MQSAACIAIAVLLFAAGGVAADTRIHRCLQDDGTFAFQEIPCAEPAVPVDKGDEADESHSDSGTPAAAGDSFDFVNPFDEPAKPPAATEAPLPEPASDDRAECEKLTRDAIDGIDLEMRANAYTKAQGEEYLAELLALTRQLRACKQL